MQPVKKRIEIFFYSQGEMEISPKVKIRPTDVRRLGGDHGGNREHCSYRCGM